MLTKVAGKVIENIEEIRPNGPAVSMGLRMALEGSDFQMELPCGMVYFNVGADRQNRTALNVWFDPGWVEPFRFTLYEQSRRNGPSLATKDTKGETQLKPASGCPMLLMFWGEPGDEDKTAFTLRHNFKALSDAIWGAYDAGEFCWIDHEAFGVKRLSEEEIQAKIADAQARRAAASAPAQDQAPVPQEATAAAGRRTRRSRDQSPTEGQPDIKVVDGGKAGEPATNLGDTDPTKWEE